MSQQTKIVLSVLAALVVVGLISFFHGKQVYGAASTLGVSGTPITLSGGSVPTLNSALEASESFISDGASYLLGSLFLGGTATSTSVQIKPVAGTCTTASSTIFAVQNPFGATSTLAYLSMFGQQGVTSTDILVGTSTTNAPASSLSATSSIGANLVNMALVATGTQFYTNAGVLIGSNIGYNIPNSIPNSISKHEAVVGPTEWIIGFSTSTTGNLGAVNGGTTTATIAIPKSCTFKMLWYSQ